MEQVIDLASANARLHARRTSGEPLPSKPRNSTRTTLHEILASERANPDLGAQYAGDADWGARAYHSSPWEWLTAAFARFVAAVRDDMHTAGVLREHVGARLWVDFPAAVAGPAALPWRRGLLITGHAGTGKTRLAAALLRMALFARDQVTAASLILAGDLFSAIRESYRDGSERSEREIVDRVCSLPFLALDDFGREGGARDGRASEAVMTAMHRILTRRIGDQLPTVVTSNLTLPEIERRFDPAIASRLAAMGQVVLAGPDRRRA